MNNNNNEVEVLVNIAGIPKNINLHKLRANVVDIASGKQITEIILNKNGALNQKKSVPGGLVPAISLTKVGAVAIGDMGIALNQQYEWRNPVLFAPEAKTDHAHFAAVKIILVKSPADVTAHNATKLKAEFDRLDGCQIKTAAQPCSNKCGHNSSFQYYMGGDKAMYFCHNRTDCIRARERTAKRMGMAPPPESASSSAANSPAPASVSRPSSHVVAAAVAAALAANQPAAGNKRRATNNDNNNNDDQIVDLSSESELDTKQQQKQRSPSQSSAQSSAPTLKDMTDDQLEAALVDSTEGSLKYKLALAEYTRRSL